MTNSPAAQIAPSAARNREPILDALRSIVPSRGTILEVASGTGEHALWFSTALPHLLWQPTDRDPEALESIAAWRADGGANLLAPLHLDAASHNWPVLHAEAVVSINMVHIAPWRASIGLMAGAGRVLGAAGPLILYGPFREAPAPLRPGNVAFDEDLRARDPAWGLREVAALEALAAEHGLTLDRRIEMPADNLVLVFRRGSAHSHQAAAGG